MHFKSFLFPSTQCDLWPRRTQSHPRDVCTPLSCQTKPEQLYALIPTPSSCKGNILHLDCLKRNQVKLEKRLIGKLVSKHQLENRDCNLPLDTFLPFTGITECTKMKKYCTLLWRQRIIHAVKTKTQNVAPLTFTPFRMFLPASVEYQILSILLYKIGKVKSDWGKGFSADQSSCFAKDSQSD